MKAITFLEWILNKQSSAWIIRGEHDENFYLNTDLVDKVANFYSLPFKPELITELFEGWGEHQNKIYSCRFDRIGKGSYNNIIEVFFSDKVDRISYGNSIIRNHHPQNIVMSILPKSLNDFISDCQRAGIELTFKQEVINKFFKFK